MKKLMRTTVALMTAMLLAACAGMDGGDFGMSGDDGSPFASPFGFDDGFPGMMFGSDNGLYDGGFPDSNWGWRGMGGYDPLPLPP